MISKELLIIALGNRWIDATSGRTVEEKFTLTPTGNYILFGYKGYNHWNDSINTYELAHKCKEWALSWKYTITPIVILSGKNYLKYMTEVKSFHNPSIDRKAFEYFRGCPPIIYNSEPEAIFKSCEWILEQIKKQK